MTVAATTMMPARFGRWSDHEIRDCFFPRRNSLIAYRDDDFLVRTVGIVFVDQIAILFEIELLFSIFVTFELSLGIVLSFAFGFVFNIVVGVCVS